MNRDFVGKKLSADGSGRWYEAAVVDTEVLGQRPDERIALPFVAVKRCIPVARTDDGFVEQNIVNAPVAGQLCELAVVDANFERA